MDIGKEGDKKVYEPVVNPVPVPQPNPEPVKDPLPERKEPVKV